MSSVLRPLAAALYMALSACHSVAPPDGTPPTGGTPALPALAGTSWVADDIDGGGVLDRVQSTITFESNERIVGSTGCNQYFAPVQMAGVALRVGVIGSTRRACPPDVMNQERRFLVALEAARAFRHDRGLALLDETVRERMRLTRIGGRAELARAFDCPDGPSFVLVSAAAGDADLELPDGVRRLARQPTGSGARYSDGTVTVWNKGREASLERAGRTYRCVENRPTR